jgi:pimeloyl-ACP methyl ester carboxylesterase
VKLLRAVILSIALLLMPACLVSDPAPSEIVEPHYGGEWLPDVSGVAYGPEPFQLLDVYRARATPVGTIIFIHGGGFTGGTREPPLRGLGALMRQRDLGWHIVSIDYRLAPRYPFPAGYEDAQAAVAWINANGASVGVCTSPVVIAGGSAGGTIAALTALRGANVVGWVSIAGILDFTSGLNSWSYGVQWLGSSLGLTFVSPLLWWEPRDPIGYVIHGEYDFIVEPENAFRADRVGGDRIWVDIVEKEGHVPTGGTNAAALIAWFDQARGSAVCK